MISKFLSAIVGLSSAMAAVGPQALYQLLNGQTFNPPGYTIVMYQSCMQNQNAGNPCGSFSTYQTSGGQYSYQLYGPEAPVSTTCSRTFHLTLACGATMSMSGVNENPTCVYSATLTLPQACGVDMTVGNEAASVSGTAVPATPSSSYTGTISGTQTSSSSYTGTSSYSQTISGTQTQTSSYTGTSSYSQTISGTQTGTPNVTSTSTPLFEITPYPSRSVTASILATTTPLFMMTAWPTVSPVNVSASTSPRFMYTAYPSYVPNASVVPAAASEPLSPTATILGAVAVGLVGLIAVGFVVNHFRKGGTVSGLVKEVQSKKEEIKKVASMLPLSEDQKAKLDKAISDPSSLLPVEAQKMVESVKQVKAQVVDALPISEEQKAQINTVIESLPQKLVEKVSPPVVDVKPEPVPEPEVKKEVPQREVSIVTDEAHLAAVKALLGTGQVKTD